MLLMCAPRTSIVKPECARHDVARVFGARDTWGMSDIDPRLHLRAWRDFRGKTLEEVAEAIGMTHQNLGKIERRQVALKLERLFALAEVYKTSIETLVKYHPLNRPLGDVADEIRGFDSERMAKVKEYIEFLKQSQSAK